MSNLLLPTQSGKYFFKSFPKHFGLSGLADDSGKKVAMSWG
jgi:hypothetical protein